MVVGIDISYSASLKMRRDRRREAQRKEKKKTQMVISAKVTDSFIKSGGKSYGIYFSADTVFHFFKFTG